MKKLSDIARAIVPPFESCGNCNKDGWVEMRSPQAGRVSVRCQCWRIHQEKVAQAATSQAKDRL